jgi:hypothetical protein
VPSPSSFPLDQSPPVSPSSPPPTNGISIPEPEGPSAEEVKERGNVAFKAKQYTQAIDLYTQAIGTPHPAPPPRVADNRDFHRHETHGTVISH